MRRLIVVFLLSGIGSMFGQADSTVTIRHVMTLTPSRPDEENPTSLRSTYYVHMDMRRIDSLDKGGRVSFTRINDCATREGLIADPLSREYRTFKLPRQWTDQQVQEYIEKHPADAVRIESRTGATSEKKVVFGFTAKHFITTIERPMKNGIGGSEVVDAWYIEHGRIECPSTRSLPGELSGAILVDYPELPDMHHVGPIPTGSPVEMTITTKWAGGRHGSGSTSKSEWSVESISDSAIDPKTFDVPTGFRVNPDLLKPR